MDELRYEPVIRTRHLEVVFFGSPLALVAGALIAWLEFPGGNWCDPVATAGVFAGLYWLPVAIPGLFLVLLCPLPVRARVTALWLLAICGFAWLLNRFMVGAVSA